MPGEAETVVRRLNLVNADAECGGVHDCGASPTVCEATKDTPNTVFVVVSVNVTVLMACWAAPMSSTVAGRRSTDRMGWTTTRQVLRCLTGGDIFTTASRPWS